MYFFATHLALLSVLQELMRFIVARSYDLVSRLDWRIYATGMTSKGDNDDKYTDSAGSIRHHSRQDQHQAGARLTESGVTVISTDVVIAQMSNDGSNPKPDIQIHGMGHWR
jgi:hypothetical protein